MARARRKALLQSRYCVACGSCVKVCPRLALYIESGVTAVVEEEACVGCGKCVKVCPAGLIQLEEREQVAKAVV